MRHFRTAVHKVAHSKECSSDVTLCLALAGIGKEGAICALTEDEVTGQAPEPAIERVERRCEASGRERRTC